MMRAIWYRHWLELRPRLMIAGLPLALLAILYLAAVSLADTPPTPEPEVMGWVGHTWLSGVAALCVSLLLGGTGIRTNGFEPGHPSLYYTLTLPVSRFTWIWTRFAIGLAAAVALFVAVLVTALVALLISGQGVPLAAMARSSLQIGLLAVAIQAVVGVLVPMWDDRWGPPAAAAVFVVVVFSGSAILNDAPAASPWLTPAMAFFASPPVPWNALGAVVLVAGAALGAAAVIARERDF